MHPYTSELASRSASSTCADVACTGAPPPVLVLRTSSVNPSPRTVLAIACHSFASSSTRPRHTGRIDAKVEVRRGDRDLVKIVAVVGAEIDLELAEIRRHDRAVAGLERLDHRHVRARERARRVGRCTGDQPDLADGGG